MEQLEEKQERWEERRQARQERWAEKHEQRLQQMDEWLVKAIAAIEEAAKLSRDAMRESRSARAVTGEHEEKIKTIGRSNGFLKRRSDDMKQPMKLASVFSPINPNASTRWRAVLRSTATNRCYSVQACRPARVVLRCAA